MSAHGMTVAGLLAIYCVADPLSRSDGPPSPEEFDAFLTGAERLFRFSADSLFPPSFSRPFSRSMAQVTKVQVIDT